MQLVIRNASITGTSGTRDIGIDGGRITAVEPHVEGQTDREIDAAGNLVSAGFVDAHTHLDKALVLDRYDWAQREMQATSRMTAVVESDKMKRYFTVDDVRQRAVRLARMCAARGTTTLRTHVDIDEVVGLVDMEGVLAAKEEVRDLIDIQVCPYAINGFEGSAPVRTAPEASDRDGCRLGGRRPRSRRGRQGPRGPEFSLWPTSTAWASTSTLIRCRRPVPSSSPTSPRRPWPRECRAGLWPAIAGPWATCPTTSTGTSLTSAPAPM